MELLIIGIALFIGVHFTPTIFINFRNNMLTTNKKGYSASFAILSIIGIVLIVVGWKQVGFIEVYQAPTWGRHLTMLLMLIAFFLFGLSHSKVNLKTKIRHPMLWGVIVWATAHLLANGDLRSIILFSSFLAWGALSQLLINKRDGQWQKPEVPASRFAKVRFVLISAIIYLVVFYLHEYIAGIPLLHQ